MSFASVYNVSPRHEYKHVSLTTNTVRVKQSRLTFVTWNRPSRNPARDVSRMNTSRRLPTLPPYTNDVIWAAPTENRNT